MAALLLATCASLAAVILASCQDSGAGKGASNSSASITVTRPARQLNLPLAATITSEPILRVRIASNHPAATFHVEPAEHADLAVASEHDQATVIVGPTQREGMRTAEARRFRPPVRIARSDNRWRLETGSGSFHWDAPWLRVESFTSEPLTVDDTRYPGAVVLVPLNYRGRETGTFDAVNHVLLEAYLPGVVEREMWPNWNPSAFQAQAIAARTYALFERSLNSRRHYDLTSTTASQVYGGEAANASVLAAVRETRGEVLTFQGRILPAFYSSCCGGRSQSASSAFPHFGSRIGLTPLRSQPHRQWCAQSNHYRWGPIQRDTDTLTRRFAAWGRANRHPVAGIAGTRRIDIIGRSASGRPTAFAVTDPRGHRFVLAAEQFRFAANYAGDGLPELPFEQQLRSSDVRPTVAGAYVRFTDGRGFGHGVGMCQWGAQGMAQRGHDAHAILHEFYPDSRIQRLY